MSWPTSVSGLLGVITKLCVLFAQETLLLDAMFEVPGSNVKTVHINEDCVNGTSQPEYIRHTDADGAASATAGSSAGETSAGSSSDEEESTQVRVKQ